MGPVVPADLDSFIARGRHLLIYGGPGSGKTRLAMHLASRAIAKELKVVVLFSEAGTLPLIARTGLSLGHYPIYDIDELARKVTIPDVMGFFTAVDTLNSFYADDLPNNASLLAYVSSILKEGGGVSVAQARKQGSEPAGLRFVEPYIDAVIETRKIEGGLFEALLRPVSTSDSTRLRFRPKGWHVEWVY